MKITYFGHSCFLIVGQECRGIKDPSLKGRPLFPECVSDVSAIRDVVDSRAARRNG
jgi:L-ascorbate metabolism protein UlaG (beta-lactamase superfamily)